MEEYLMNFDRGALKADARTAIRESRLNPYLVALSYVAILYLLNYLQTRLTGIVLNYEAMRDAMLNGTYFDYVLGQVQSQMPSGGEALIGALLSLLGVGYTISTLRVSRRQPNVMGNLFDGFAIFFRVIWLEILIWLFTFLWSLLFVIPGIVASYRYRQAIYLLVDHPDMSALECIRESKRLMTGHKGELFVMDLSFLGWFILSAVPFVLIYVAPYTSVSYALYYNYLLTLDGRPWVDAEPHITTDQTPPWEGR